VRVGQGRRHGVHCAWRSYGVHGVAHVPALDIWSRVLRGNVHGHSLLNCGYVRPTRMLGPLRGCMSHLAQFGIFFVVGYVHVMR
jgi:hypothetical protein